MKNDSALKICDDIAMQWSERANLWELMPMGKLCIGEIENVHFGMLHNTN
jgi:hypothetical protein